jgi:5S rRNA maturation endonuclease (ribonuclease M5)
MLTKKCLICKGGVKNDCLYWHRDKETSQIWVWCQGKCQRGYSILEYCNAADISLSEFLKQDFQFHESKPNEVQAMAWPARFISLADPRAALGVEYVCNTRNLNLDGDMYYDMDRHGIVFPYYFDNHFVGAQTRFIVPRTTESGDEQKMDTLPGTRLGLLFYGWNQSRFMGNVKGVIVCEGSFNALSINQSLNIAYGGISRNPWRCVSTSGSGLSSHQAETLKNLKNENLKIVIAPDTDEAGQKMLKKAVENDCITHFALTEDIDLDWNDKLSEFGHLDFAKFFLKQVKKVT